MSPRVTPTLLLRRRSVRIWIALSVVVGVAAVRLFLEVYSSVDEKMQWEIEIIAGLLILGTLGNLGAYWIATRRNTRLESELRRSRSDETAQQIGTAGDGAPVLTTLGAAISEYNSSLNRSRELKTARIVVQRQLLRVVLRATEKRLLVLSASGSVLYMSAASAEEYEGETEPRTPLLDPSGAAIAAHLLAGNGPGTVSVDDRPMHFIGVFGQTVSGGDWRHNDAADAALAYIVITENAVTAGPTTTTSRPHQQPDRLYKKLWSVITRR
ncbi:MAG: hypothetical protein PF508_08175 [Spirochaeta sp.]|jgi:hypothetical protein|nr:hypothetical protein [Spirochaeta sp.]